MSSSPIQSFSGTRNGENPPKFWRDQLLESLKFSQSVEEWLPLAESDRSVAIAAKANFPMMVPQGYADLINWQDPQDPLRQLLMPSAAEHSDAGSYDTSGEDTSTILPGLQHKYEQTAVFLVTQACAGHCRYCFRRRLMSRDILTQESIEDLEPAIAYVSQHPEIDNILLSGGDPMVCSTKRLAHILAALEPIAHLWQIRISSKLPAFLPTRFTTDPELLALFRHFSTRFQLVIQCHFDHPRELTLESKQALSNLRAAGCLLTSQIPIIKGVNDQVETLTQLFKQLHQCGVLPQYLFHPRPVKHATHFQIPIQTGLALVDGVRQHCNGAVKRFRYIVTQPDGKLELVGQTDDPSPQLVTRWHQVRRGLRPPSVQLYPLDPQMVWLDVQAS